VGGVTSTVSGATGGVVGALSTVGQSAGGLVAGVLNGM